LALDDDESLDEESDDELDDDESEDELDEFPDLEEDFSLRA